MSNSLQHQPVSRNIKTLIGKPRFQALELESLDLDVLARDIFPSLNIQLLQKIISPNGKTELLVAEMSLERFENLKRAYDGRLIVEEDRPLDLFKPTGIDLPIVPNFKANLIPLKDDELTIPLMIRDSQTQQPIANAHVTLIGSLWYADGITDAAGRITLTLYGETADTLSGLMVRPAANYWSFWLDQPVLRPGQDNVVALKAFDQTLADFPQTESLGWGQKAMGLGDAQIPYRGNGIKIGIIDSGGYIDHQDLGDHANGKDFTAEATPTSWKLDPMAHGTHVAGVIVGLMDEFGIRGFAPEADYHVCKIFPGGTFSALINSLNECMTAGVDIVNLSLGSSTYSELLEQKIQEVTDAGVACIAAAGNSATKIQYPAAYDDVLAVSAIGQVDTFPSSSAHIRQVGAHKSADGKFFTAKFTCFADVNQRLDVCAPGVAVVSAVSAEADAYAAWDGTSMACPHVVGLAALILEARSDIRAMSRERGRVNALFQAIRESAVDLGLPYPYQGHGLPQVLKALKIPPEAPDADTPDSPWTQIEELLQQILKLLRSQVET